MTDKEKEPTGDGTVIFTEGPPSLRRDPAPPATPPAQDKPPATPPAEQKPSAPPAPSASDEDEGDVTQVLPRNKPPHESTVMLEVPPPTLAPQKPAAPASQADSTAAQAVPPPSIPASPVAKPATQPAPPAAPPAPPAAPPKPSAPASPPASASSSSTAPPSVGGHDTPPSRPDITDRTRIVPPRSTDATTVNWDAPRERPWITLEHVLPAEYAGTQEIDKEVVVLGRALECEVRLFSASASRQHARIEQRPDGWYLIPMEGKRVIVDGRILDGEVMLEAGMRLGLGDDEIVVVDQEEPQPYEESQGVRWQVAIPVALGTAASLLVLAWLFGMF